ncbi:hypothetical protein JOC77_003866 [Peribacillus deserti]|uniref:YuzL family protein n=1 Tax=Peribacillus deserti TaxID=673318 RepID=A0ABS2QN66_9BACI|nr:hypothetical protein [Peribacillus deserti]MBM7694405.1 hypothetical protein [Peribacillus deserti]
MTESNQSEQVTETSKKKVSLQDAIKQQLANKKNQSSGGKSITSTGQAGKKMKSQQTKKVSNQRRKMGT